MKITKERLLEIIKEEIHKHNQLQERIRIPPRLAAMLRAGGSAAQRAKATLLNMGVPADKIKALMPATKLGKAKAVAGLNLAMMGFMQGVPQGMETLWIDFERQLKRQGVRGFKPGDKRFWGKVWKAVKKEADRIGVSAIEVVEVLSPATLAKNVEIILRSPITALSERKENAIAVVWPGYRVNGAVPVGHAGIALIAPNGKIRYYSVGRYGKQTIKRRSMMGGTANYASNGKGGVLRTRAKYNSDGEIVNIDKVLKALKRFGQGAMEAVIVRDVDYESAKRYASTSIPQEYSMTSDMAGVTCATWVVNVLSAGGGSSLAANMRSKLIASPRKLIPLLQNDYDERYMSV